MSTAGIFWSRNLCLSVIMLFRTKFRVNQNINRPDIAEKRFSLWGPSAMAVCHVEFTKLWHFVMWPSSEA